MRLIAASIVIVGRLLNHRGQLRAGAHHVNVERLVQPQTVSRGHRGRGAAVGVVEGRVAPLPVVIRGNRGDRGRGHWQSLGREDVAAAVAVRPRRRLWRLLLQ